jgi:hypothetical protein
MGATHARTTTGQGVFSSNACGSITVTATTTSVQVVRRKATVINIIPTL